MVEISLSGSGEGPSWATARPTLQRHFCAAPPAAPAGGGGAGGTRIGKHGLDRHRCGGQISKQSALKSVFKEWYPDMEVEVVPEAAESPGSPYSRSLRPEHQAASRVGAR